jgi:hypothetical protein
VLRVGRAACSLEREPRAVPCVWLSRGGWAVVGGQRVAKEARPGEAPPWQNVDLHYRAFRATALPAAPDRALLRLCARAFFGADGPFSVRRGARQARYIFQLLSVGRVCPRQWGTVRLAQQFSAGARVP